VRKTVILCLVAIFPITQIETATGDTANPPVITSVTQLSSGPYKPGDVLTVRVDYTGGNPGLSSITVAARNLFPASIDMNWSATKLNNGILEYTAFGLKQRIRPSNKYGNGIVSRVLSGCNSDNYIYRAQITDLTRLGDEKITWKEQNIFKLPGNLDYKIVSDFCIPVGQVLPPKTPDEIDLTNLGSNLEFSSKKQTSYVLPRTSKYGQPIIWSADGACMVEVDFPEDAGGSLVTEKTGDCRLSAYMETPTDKYESPKINSSYTFSRSNNNDYPKIATLKVIDPELKASEAAAKIEKDKIQQQEYDQVVNDYQKLFARIAALRKEFPSDTSLAGYDAKLRTIQIVLGRELNTARANYNGVSSKIDAIESILRKTQKTTILCIKGKSIKKVSGIGPKCPAGFKKK
jgi:hypothetical protein